MTRIVPFLFQPRPDFFLCHSYSPLPSHLTSLSLIHYHHHNHPSELSDDCRTWCYLSPSVSFHYPHFVSNFRLINILSPAFPIRSPSQLLHTKSIVTPPQSVHSIRKDTACILPKLLALSPHHIVIFFSRNGKIGWLSLGGTVICITVRGLWSNLTLSVNQSYPEIVVASSK